VARGYELESLWRERRPPSLTIIDAKNLATGAPAVIGTLPTGAFPRELRVTADERTLLLTNFDSKNVAVIDVPRIAPNPRSQ
jgi:DNA-binding beta-propeller fold protein YncE